MKHLIRSLSQSDDGVACLGFFGSLTEVFSSDVSALVAYEFAKLLYPGEKLPAVSQWQRLLAACSGTMTTSNFPLIAEQFIGLAGNRRAVTSKGPFPTMPSRIMGDIKDFAQALNAICLIARDKEQRSISIVGGPSCGFLAAFAHWFLALEVEIRHKDSSEVLYTSMLDNEPQIIIIYDKAATQGQELAVQMTERTYIVRQVEGGILNRVDNRHLLYYGGRVRSDCAIRSAFGDQGRKLLSDTNLAVMLGKAARILWLLNACEGPTTHFTQNAMGLEYLDAASAVFPEIDNLIGLARQPATEDSLVSSVQIYEGALADLKCNCFCRECKKPSRGPEDIPVVIACLGVLAEVLISAVWDLKNVCVLGEHINPSIRGLQHLYSAWEDGFRIDETRHARVHGATLFRFQDGEHMKLVKPPLSLATICFTAMTILGGEVGDSYDLFQKLKNGEQLALSSNGTCFYFNILEQVTDIPSLATQLNVIPGCIQSPSGHTFLQIEDLYHSVLDAELPNNQVQERRAFDVAMLFDNTGAPLSAELVATETSSSLYVQYKLTSIYGSCKLSPGRLMRRILRSSIVGYCAHRPNSEVLPPNIPTAPSMLDGEGAANAVEDLEHGNNIVVRRLHGNIMGRCVALVVRCHEFWVTYRAILRQHEQCFNCCLAKAEELRADLKPDVWGRVIIYIIM